MSWGYHLCHRQVDDEHVWDVHEVYLDTAGGLMGATSREVSPAGYDLRDFALSLARYMDILSRPVFDIDMNRFLAPAEMDRHLQREGLTTLQDLLANVERVR